MTDNTNFDSILEGLPEEIREVVRQALAQRQTPAETTPVPPTAMEDIDSGRGRAEVRPLDDAVAPKKTEGDMPLIFSFDDNTDDMYSSPKAAQPVKTVSPSVPAQEPTVAEEPSVAEEPTSEDVPEDTPAPRPPRRNPFKVFWQGFCRNLPRRGDRGGALVRKIAFLLALVMLFVSAGYIVYDVALQPASNSSMYEGIAQIYRPQNTQPVTAGNYPDGMMAAFVNLYNQNKEVRGWLTYSATGKKDFLNINYPVMQAEDNDKYLTHDFYEKKNKNGALFFDMDNAMDSPYRHDKVQMIYGHNMASGQMFAGLNKLVGNVNNAKATTTLTLSTLFKSDTYKVFAVILTDENAQGSDYFHTRRLDFPTDEDFLSYVEQVRARSLFDYPVEVEAQDDLLVLSTCTNTSTAKFKNGRCLVYARRVRLGESREVDTARIVKNEDVIMPRAWYEKQDLPLHEYYNGGSSFLPGTPMGGYTTYATDATDTTDTTGNSTTDTTGTTGSTADTGTTAAGDSTTTLTGSVTAGGTTVAGTDTTAPSGTADTTATGGEDTTATAGADSTTEASGESTAATQPVDTTDTTEATQPGDTTEATETTDSTEPADTTATTENTTTEPAGETTAAAE